jgi:hypothetical protein
LALDGNKELQAQMALLQKKLDVLLAQTKKRNQKEYGPKIERHNPRPAPAATGKRAFSDSGATPAQRNHEKHILSQNLPVERVNHKVDQSNLTCSDCLVETVAIGHKVSYQLERIMQTLKKIKHVQEVRSCSKCRSHVVTAQKPAAPIPGSYVGPTLLAYTCVAKLAGPLETNYSIENILT